MSEMTPKQKTLVKARKAARVSFALIMMGGAILLLFGIYTQYLPTVLNGAVLFACAVPVFVVSKIAEKRLGTSMA